MAAAAVRELYVSSLSRAFPPVEFAFAYGSAVFQQRGRGMVNERSNYAYRFSTPSC